MKKLSFLLAVIMMLSFSACGGGTGTTSNEQTTQNTEQTEPGYRRDCRAGGGSDREIPGQ